MLTLTQKFLPVLNSKEMNRNTDKDLDQKMFVPSYFSCVWLFATLWTEACQAPLPMRVSREEYQSGLTCPLCSRGSSRPRIEPESPASSALQANSWLLSHWGSPLFNTYMYQICILYILFDTNICYVYFKAETVAVDVLLSLLSLSCVRLFVTLWTEACQASLSMEYYGQE